MISRRKVDYVATPYAPTTAILLPEATSQTYVIPPGITTVMFDLVGNWPLIPVTVLSTNSGNPGRVQGTWTLSGAGTTVTYLYYVGGNGGAAIQFPGADPPRPGSRGGHAPAMFDGATLIAIAGGGGGGISPAWSPGARGDGGGLVAGNGFGSGAYGGGGGGTQSAGGIGGFAYNNEPSSPIFAGNAPGGATPRQGGNGGVSGGGKGTITSRGATGGGGGGAGYHGGGGGGGGIFITGGGGTSFVDFAGGGGGGSSYTDPTVVSGVTHTQGYAGPSGTPGVIQGFNSNTIRFGGNYIILTY